jgi:hypothetical protein
VLGQRLQVTKRPQANGEAGVFSSLEAVAQKISAGSIHPKVKAWANEQLVRARQVQGIPCRTERERAQVLLAAVQKKLWIPDPVHAEFIAGAHLLACDRSTKDELCFLSGDCDELSVLLGACFLSVGLNTMVVGHGYGASKNISHVLTAVHVNGRWHYADPTPEDFRLGECAEFSRERLLSVPNVQVLCDDDVCLTDKSGYNPDKNDFVTEGHFVAVDGRPKFYWLRKPTPEMLGEVSAQAVIDRCTAGRSGTKEDLKGAAGCAADGFCLSYGVPPGICGGITDAIFSGIEEVFSHPAGPGFEGLISRTMYLHNRLLPREPRWDWVKVAPGSGIARAGGYYQPNAAVIAAYQRRGFTFTTGNLTSGPLDWNQFYAANAKVSQDVAARAAEVRAREAAKPTPKLVPALALGAAGAATWYFWPTIVRFFR